MSRFRVHIGHHFFGSGNLGDDLMLAGFLEAARSAWLPTATLTCCTPHDAGCQCRRFPEIVWLPYDDDTRAACIARADAWLGLGGTPFQATGGHTWFLDHLCQEAAWCRLYGTPMYYLGVGVNERAAANYPQTRDLVEQAERLWTRDENSAEMLRPLTSPGKIVAGADLAHLALETMRFCLPEPGTLGLVLSFEDATQFRLEGLTALLRAAQRWRVRWLAQEVRPLPGSETRLHGLLPAGPRGEAPLRTPDYAGAASAHALLAGWDGTEAMFVSRYHATLIGAWMGARVAAFARSDKVAGAIRQLGLATVPDLNDPAAILRVVEAARPVERRVLLELAGQARANCEGFFAVCSSSPPPSVPAPTKPPSRLLFLLPDADGGLCLFEPVLRIVRDAWPQTEVAVLIRESCRDIAPLLNAAGVEWLTTACDPYRQAPGDNPAALEALRDTVRAFVPDCVVAACAEQSWLESAVAAFLPGVRQVSFGPGLTDSALRAALDAVLPVNWSTLYPERIPVGPDALQWERNLRLASALIGREAPRWRPVVQVPASARTRAQEIVAAAGLKAAGFVACAAGGSARAAINRWPAEAYGETLARMEREWGVRALLVGHVSERAVLEAARERARQEGVEPALWLAEDSETPIVAALLDAARLYLGNDSGALHLAAALGRPVVGIFCGGTWPQFQPVAVRARSVVQRLPCFGCAGDCLYVDAPCVRTISQVAVRQALREILNGVAGNVVVEADGLDAGARTLIDTATPRLRFQRANSAARLRQVTTLARRTEELSACLQVSEADRAARLSQVEELTTLLHTSEADRAARLSQVEELTALLKTSETDRAARFLQIEELTAMVKASEAERATG